VLGAGQGEDAEDGEEHGWTHGGVSGRMAGAGGFAVYVPRR